VAEGLSVRGLASGGIDISDGLAADLDHLLTQSGCGATVYLERLPLSPALRALDDPDRRRALALAGGDDYELCFTVPPQQRPMLESRWRGAPMTSIGRIEASPGLRWICADGSTYHPPAEGYRHFYLAPSAPRSRADCPGIFILAKASAAFIRTSDGAAGSAGDMPKSCDTQYGRDYARR
jgi:hypothetical protein